MTTYEYMPHALVDLHFGPEPALTENLSFLKESFQTDNNSGNGCARSSTSCLGRGAKSWSDWAKG